MPFPPMDLSRHFAYKAILASAGVSVKGFTPEIAECPICRHRSLSVFSDPVLSGESRWLYCGMCAFHGDTLEVFKNIRNAPDIRTAIAQAISEGLCTTSLGDVTQEHIAAYEMLYYGRRLKQEKIWADLRAGLGQTLSPDMVRRAQKEHLWGAWHSGHPERMNRFLGGGTRRDVTKIFDDFNLVPKTGFPTVLAMNYQDVPGRTCAFNLLGDNDGVFKFIVDHNNQSKEGGLAMLDTLRAFEETVYAVDEPHLALQLQRRRFIDSEEPLKLVCFNDLTSRAWRSVHANRAILLSRRLDWQLFNHARQVKNAFIATEPAFTRDRDALHKLTSGVPLGVLFNDMEGSAVPWRVAFARWATGENDTVIVSEAVARLAFNVEEREALLQECPGEILQRFENILGKSSIARGAVINRHNVTERDGGWYVSTGLREAERISDVVVKIYSEINDVSTRTPHWSGVIEFKGKQLPFCDPLDKIRSSPIDWINSYTVSAGLGTPTIQPRWVSQLLHVAKTFSPNSDCVTANSRLGLYPDGSVHFPRFKIADSVFEEIRYSNLWPGRPGQSVLMPVQRSRRPTDTVFPARAVYTAAVSIFIANWIATARDEPRMPVVLSGGFGSLAQSVGRHLAKSLGLRIESPGIRSDVDEQRETAGEYNYPLYIEPKMPGLLINYPGICNDFVFLLASECEAASLALGGHWIIINAPQGRSDSNLLPPADDVAMYLADLQRREFDLPDTPHLVCSVLEDFCRWYDRYLGVSQHDELLAMASKYIQIPVNAGDSLVELFCTLLQHGGISIDHAPMTHLESNGIGKSAIVIDDESGKVFLSRERLISAVRKARLPMPEIARSTEDLVARRLALPSNMAGQGWCLQKGHWDNRIKVWQDRHLRA